MARHYSLSPLTKNSKLGFMATTISPKSSCPDTCPLKENGDCYALVGLLRIHWNRLDEKGLSWDQFISGIKKLPKGFKFRGAQAGEALPGDNLEIDLPKLDELIGAVSHLQAYTYTHKPVLDSKRAKGKLVKKSILKKNRAAIQKANQSGFTINLSCDSLSEVDEAKRLNIAPTVVTLPMDAPAKLTTPEGHKVIGCPAQLGDTTCADCMLCQKQRSVTVGFYAHGTAKKRLSKRLTAANQ